MQARDRVWIALVAALVCASVPRCESRVVSRHPVTRPQMAWEPHAPGGAEFPHRLPAVAVPRVPIAAADAR